MNQLTFMDEAHETFFYEAQAKHHFSFKDAERSALFYALGLMPETRTNIRSLYDLGGIIPNGINAAFQTSGSRAITSLAYILYNDFKEHVSDEPDIMTSPSLLRIFCSVDHDYVPYLFNAIMIRIGMIKIDA